MKDTEAARTKNAGVTYAGVDVSKGTLDIDAGDLGVTKVANTPMEVRKALAALGRKAGAGRPLQVCFESTGPYAGTLLAECQAKGIPCSVLNPSLVAHFAKSVAPAKTDAIDAGVIRRYAQARRPEPAQPVRKALAVLDELILSREAVMKNAVMLRSMLETVRHPAAAKPIRRTIAFNEKRIAEYDRLIAEAVKADEETAGLVGALSAVKGVGVLTAAKIVSGMPEIGRLGRRKAARLAGLAPRTQESGTWRGKSRIGGGRGHVREALFMPATVAIRHDPEAGRVHGRLTARGKPYKVALTAVMRRLICHLDSVARAYYAKREQAQG
jgi:transposase